MDNKNIAGQVHNAVYQNIQKKGYASSTDVLIFLGVLSKESYENWRFGKVDYLERVCTVNLKKLSSIMREIRTYANKTGLKPSFTSYHGWGNNKNNQFRFSKSGNDSIERHYATHYVKVGN